MEENMPVRSADRSAKRMRLAGRVLCLLITAYGGVILVGGAIGEHLAEGSITSSAAGTWLVVIGVVALVGCILSWRRELPAGIILVVTAAALGVHIGFYAGRNYLITWAMLGLPYLVLGVLLLLAWWRLRRGEPADDASAEA